MDSVLGRKQRIKNSDWIETFDKIEQLITKKELDQLVDKTIQDIKAKTKGKKAAYAWSGGKDSLVLGEICRRAGISSCVLVISNLEYKAFTQWVEDNKPPELSIINTGQDIKWLVTHPHMLFPQDSKYAAQWFHSAFGLYDLKRQINRIANLDHKLTVREWKKAVSKTLGIDLLDDYYSGEYYAQMLEKWVSDNVDLIKTVPNQSLERMKELVYESYMKGSTTTNIVREIQRQYGMSKRHAKLIARDQTAKLNADITESQQRDAGVSKYEWSGVMDRRERKSHRELEGKIISWDNPPDVGNGRKCHPGQDYQCRCCAIPVFDIDNLDLPV